MRKRPAAFYWINAITLYRIVTAPLLLVAVFTGPPAWFKWMLGLSFFTDMIDGVLARSFKVNSTAGARLDSIGDDLTVLVATTGLLITAPSFFREQITWLVPLLLLFACQTGYAFYRYGRMSSFHTRLAKLAALAQGVFLLSFFFFEKVVYPLFFSAVIITGLELIEEIVLVYLLPVWTTNVKGIYWVRKR